MMRRTDPQHYPRLASSFDEAVPNAPMLHSVLEGRNPGRVWTGDPASMEKGLVHTGYGFAFVFGGWDEELRECVLGAARDGRSIHLVVREADAGRMQGLDCSTTERLEFRGFEFREPKPIPEGCEVVEISEPLLDDCLWKGEILKACGSFENFRANGYGLCLMKGGSIAAEAYACFWGAGRVEIGAVTRPELRSHGYGTILCGQLIQECLRRGYQPYWSCHRTNLASRALAGRLGFVDCKPYLLLGVPAKRTE